MRCAPRDLKPPTPKKLNDGTWDLNLGNSDIRDLTPLKGAPISRLSLGHTAVTDLAPLRGMKLKRLAINETAVTDLEPLRGMPLEELFLSNTKVVDLSPLRGMPLKSLNLRSCISLTDVSPLAECQSLKTLILPTTAKEIEFLRSFPNLESISYKGGLAGSRSPDCKGILGRVRPRQRRCGALAKSDCPQVPSLTHTRHKLTNHHLIKRCSLHELGRLAQPKSRVDRGTLTSNAP